MPRLSDSELGELCFGGFHLHSPIEFNNPEDEVSIVVAQDWLKEHGFLKESVRSDGRLGSETKDALRAFQRARQIKDNDRGILKSVLDEWVKEREPNRQAQKDRVRGLFEALLESLPGPTWSTDAPWNDIRGVVSKWLLLNTEPGERNGMPLLCVRALREFTLVKRRLWGLVPEKDQHAYLESSVGGVRKKSPRHPQNIPALVTFWIRYEAARALKDRCVISLLEEIHRYRASARLLLVLSFVPTLLFTLLVFRARVDQNRSTRKSLIQKYKNPRTTLHEDDPYVAPLLKLRNARDPLLRHCTDAEIRGMVAQSFTSLPREREQQLWASVGLDKRPRSSLAKVPLDELYGIPTATVSKQQIWDYIFFPLVEYLEPFAPRQKDVPGIIPERVYEWASRLVYLRSRGLWGDRPDLLKARYLDLAYRRL